MNTSGHGISVGRYETYPKGRMESNDVAVLFLPFEVRLEDNMTSISQDAQRPFRRTSPASERRYSMKFPTDEASVYRDDGKWATRRSTEQE